MAKAVIDFSVYLITDKRLSGGVEGALQAGVRAVQLRDKELSTRELLDLAYRMRELTARYGAKLFINGRTDVALCAGADGVHLGQADMPAPAARKIFGNRLVGVSTHTLEEAERARSEGADFITFGPLYPTPSKLRYGAPVGLESLREVTDKISIPVFGIGGIKPGHAGGVLDSGADGIALISGILGEPDTGAAAERYLKEIEANQIGRKKR